MSIKKTALFFLATLLIIACNLIATPEPPGVGEKAELGYAVCDPIVKALEQYRAENDAYPETLAELAPKYLVEVPTDVNDQPISYTRTSGSFSLAFHYIGPGMNTCTYTPEDKWQCSGAY